MKVLFLLLRRSPGVVILAMLAGVISGASNAGLLALINTALHAERPWTDHRLVAGFVGLCLVVPVARAFSSYVLSVLGQNTVLDLRRQLCLRILSAPLRTLEEIGSHRLLAALTQDVSNVVIALSMLPLLFVHSAIVVGCLVYLGWLSWTVLLFVLAFLVVGVVTYQLPILRATGYQRMAREEADALYGHFRMVTEGTKELKLHAARQAGVIRDLDATGALLKRFTVLASTIFSAAGGWGQLVVFGLVGSIVFLIPAFQPVELKTMTGYALILLYMMTPMEIIMETVPAIARARVSFRKVEELGLSLGPDPVSLPTGAGAQAEWGSLELAAVTHSYHREGEETPFTLGPIDLALRPGEILFLVGGNGSGKTTLAKLLLGLYTPESGEVRVDGCAVTDESRAGYLERFSAVFADFFLFEKLVGIEKAGVDARAARYLRQLQLDHKVSVRDGVLSTTALSQGQRKRLALLTAYLEDRPIYLFDEWAADQDPLFKEVFYLHLLPELRSQGKTVVVISHDDHYYGVADRIVKLDYGRIEYDGPSEGFRYRPSDVSLAAAAPVA